MNSLDDHLEAVLGTGVPGVVAVVVAPGQTLEKAAGVADLESGAPLTPDHRFRIASATKLFVAALVLQLVGEGALDLDGEVDLVAGNVTVRQLLNHTSGLPNYAELDEILEPYRTDLAHRPGLTPRDALALVESRPRLFSPGEGWSYSGSNYLVLGLLIEETTSSPLRQELRRRIVEPLGLVGTDFPDPATAPDGLARGYLPPGDPMLPNPRLDPIDVTDVDLFTWGGGGMVSTAGDLARFLQALLSGQVIPPGLRAELLSTVESDWEESEGYGLGIEKVTLIEKAESPCGAAWGHLGFWPGYLTIALASETGDRQVVVLANTVLWTDEAWEALGGLTWACYCGSAQTSV